MTSREIANLTVHLDLARDAIADVRAGIVDRRVVGSRDQVLDVQLARDELLHALNILQRSGQKP